MKNKRLAVSVIALVAFFILISVSAFKAMDVWTEYESQALEKSKTSILEVNGSLNVTDSTLKEIVDCEATSLRQWFDQNRNSAIVANFKGMPSLTVGIERFMEDSKLSEKHDAFLVPCLAKFLPNSWVIQRRNFFKILEKGFDQDSKLSEDTIRQVWCVIDDIVKNMDQLGCFPLNPSANNLDDFFNHKKCPTPFDVGQEQMLDEFLAKARYCRNR